MKFMLDKLFFRQINLHVARLAHFVSRSYRLYVNFMKFFATLGEAVYTMVSLTIFIEVQYIKVTHINELASFRDLEKIATL